jgi:hypothetical protein
MPSADEAKTYARQARSYAVTYLGMRGVTRLAKQAESGFGAAIKENYLNQFLLLFKNDKRT